MPDKITENFNKFHAENPHIYAWFDRFARELMQAGYQHGSASLIFERIRWELMVSTRTEQPVKLNNNYRSRYARLWMAQDDARRGFFRTRLIRDHSFDSVNVARPATAPANG